MLLDFEHFQNGKLRSHNNVSNLQLESTPSISRNHVLTRLFEQNILRQHNNGKVQMQGSWQQQELCQEIDAVRQRMVLGGARQTQQPLRVIHHQDCRGRWRSWVNNVVVEVPQ